MEHVLDLQLASPLGGVIAPGFEWDLVLPQTAEDASHAALDGEAIPRSRSELASRAVNIVLAVIGMVVTLPFLIVMAVMIKVDSSGPVLYSQTRIGLDRRWGPARAAHEARRVDLGGRAFTIYKLRSMHVDAEQASGEIWAKEDDPRVTSVGKMLRKFRLDELPQLWNVLIGDMNIVGPRPERPTIVARLREELPGYQSRHRVKPGITGLAQINQTYDASLDDVRVKVTWDLRYIETQSVWLDLKVILLTVPAVLIKFRGW